MLTDEGATAPGHAPSARFESGTFTLHTQHGISALYCARFLVFVRAASKGLMTVLDGTGPTVGATGQMTMLHLTVSKGRGSPVLFKALLDAGADATKTNSAGQNTLHLAIEGASGGKITKADAMARYLIKTVQPASAHKLFEQRDTASGRTPLMVAVVMALPRIVKALLRKNVDPNTPDTVSPPSVPLFRALGLVGG